jgi:hypothetical protein
MSHAGQKRKNAEPTEVKKDAAAVGAAAKNRKTEGEQEEPLVQLKGVVGTGLATAGHHHRTNAEFLAALVYTRAEQLRVPDNKVFVAERTDKIVDVFRGLVNHNFLSVPVLQKTKHKWFGFLDLADIVLYVVNVCCFSFSFLFDFPRVEPGPGQLMVVRRCRPLARAS